MRSASKRASRLGGTEGNEILTSAVAAILTILLIVEGITILRIGGLLRQHMFVGLVLVPPVLLKLGSTGYRFMRYYGGSRAYREKGPPLLALRLLAPLLVIGTLAVFATGVWLLLLGHRSGPVVLLHKVAFIVWGAVFGIHFMAHLPLVLRSLRNNWAPIRRRAVPGAGIRALLVAVSLAAGIVMALSLLGLIVGWQPGQGG